MKICVAVSGGRDSMALLHYFNTCAKEYGIALFAVNCNHGIRGQASDNDTKFVEEWCLKHGIEILCFSEDCLALARERKCSVETAAREWRRACFYRAQTHFLCDAVATAHHADDNAETLLFNLARGSSLAGAQGIKDGKVFLPSTAEGEPCYCGESTERVVALNLIHPLIACTREQINFYVKENGVPYVDDESNADVAYTRNRIRHNVLPQLEEAVPGAVMSLYRFSRLVTQTESYFDKIIEERGLIRHNSLCTKITVCEDDAIFGRAVQKVLQICLYKKDYTCKHIKTLSQLRYAGKGKKFEFLHLIAYRDEGEIVLYREPEGSNEEISLKGFNCGIFGGVKLEIAENIAINGANSSLGKLLKFDLERIPDGAVIRRRKDGDKFTKFGGGTKSLGDFLTDKKVPLYLRNRLPVIAAENEILAVCGVEISEKIKITNKTQKIAYIICKID